MLRAQWKPARIKDIECLIAVRPDYDRPTRWVQLVARRHPTQTVIDYHDEPEAQRSLNDVGLSKD